VVRRCVVKILLPPFSNYYIFNKDVYKSYYNIFFLKNSYENDKGKERNANIQGYSPRLMIKKREEKEGSERGLSM
jgi:hypothetical protein